MYCAVDEAFDNPLKQQMQQMDMETDKNKYRQSLANNVEEFQQKFHLNPPHSNNNNNFGQSHGVINDYNDQSDYDGGPNGFDNYETLQLGGQYGGSMNKLKPVKYPDKKKCDKPFFTTQGNYTSQNNKSRHDKGTSLSELGRIESDDVSNDSFFDESLSMLDSNYSSMLSTDDNLSDDTGLSSNFNNSDNSKYKLKISHSYCINKFIKSIVDDGSDMLSLASSQDDELYDHIKSCKYCRTEINTRMKDIYGDRQNLSQQSHNSTHKKYKSKQHKDRIQSKHENTKKEMFINDKIFGYNVKEIITIIAISIIIIFILDLLVRVGRRAKLRK